MLVRYGNQAKKLVIDGGSCMNLVSSSTVGHLKLPTEPHPQPYKVAWIDNTTSPETHRCLDSFSCGVYGDSSMCDIIPMKVTHPFGSTLDLDRNVQHNGREHLRFNGWQGGGCFETYDLS
jgi:hypothetical protein